MLSEDNLYIVVNNATSDYNISDCFDIFKDLELAKQMLKNLYKSTFDIKYFNYEIKLYKFNNNKYELTNESYSYNYKLDKFVKHS
jgi:hypothetical protein